MTRRFGQQDTSIRTFLRFFWDAIRQDVLVPLLGLAVLVIIIFNAHSAVRGVIIVISIYAGGFMCMYLRWRYLVKKGVWWL